MKKANAIRNAACISIWILAAALFCPVVAAEAEPAKNGDVVITNARIMTVTHGTIENGSLWIRDGRIAAVGVTIDAPQDALRVDAGGRYLTPGIVDGHAHIGMGGLYDPQDTNEYEGAPWGRYAGPNQADLRIRDAIKTDDYGVYLMLSAGLTTVLQLPGSANLFGGQAAPMKMKVGRPREEMFIKSAPLTLKIACGSTPASAWKERGVGLETPDDVILMRRQIYGAARAYIDAKRAFREGRAPAPPPLDPKLEAIGEALEGRALVEMHCHKAEEILAELAAAHDYGFTIRTLHHGSEGYKVAKELAAAGTGLIAISDIWGGAPQVADGIPWNIAIAKRAGVRVALHGEGFSIARRLSQEAGKMLRYGKGTFDRNAALGLVTLDAAWTFGLDDRIGSIDIGKDADLVLWSGDPLSSEGRAEKVFIDGELYFDASLPGLGIVVVEEKRR